MSYVLLVSVCFFFFFKQKTAYEMRISDWSSDVCSSDLATGEETIVLDHDGQALTQAPGANAAPLDEGRKLGTVGAVALDLHGNLAAATSTGGLTNKRPGRVGDTPLIGAGCYANNATCAVSATGTGDRKSTRLNSRH